MDTQGHYNSEGAAWEKRVLQIFLLASVSLHLLVFLFKAPTWTKKKETLEREWEIVADFGGTELSSSVDTKINDSVGLSEREKEKMLPQLPKSFQEHKDPHQVEKVTQTEKIQAKSHAQDNPDADKISEDSTVEKTEAAKQVSIQKETDEATRIFKKDLIARLKKEQLRLEKKKNEKNRTTDKKISSMLEARKNELKGVQKSSSQATELSESHPYIYRVREQISRVYSLPGVYQIHSSQIPVLTILIAKSGEIAKLEISESSNNSAMDQLALKTVRDAAPFPEPPKEFWGQSLQLRFDPKLM